MTQPFNPFAQQPAPQGQPVQQPAQQPVTQQFLQGQQAPAQQAFAGFGTPVGNPFAGLENATITKRGQFIEPGDHVLELQRMFVQQTNTKGLCFIAEFKVLQSDRYAPGAERSFVQPMAQQGIAFSSIAELLIPLCGVAIDSPQAASLKAQLSTIAQKACAENVLAGRRVRCQAYMRKTRAGGDFTQKIWTPVA